eukprot:676744-Karenia_brevis.AAC.1
MISKTIAATLKCFPRAVFERHPPAAPRVRPPASRLCGGHVWQQAEGMSRCSNCWRSRPAGASSAEWDEPACPGIPAVLSRLAAQPNGHLIVILRAGNVAQCALCLRCGCWGLHRLRGLAQPCNRMPANDGARNVLRRVARGLHPDPRKANRQIDQQEHLGHLLQDFLVRELPTRQLWVDLPMTCQGRAGSLPPNAGEAGSRAGARMEALRQR